MVWETFTIFTHLLDGVGNMGDLSTFGWEAWYEKHGCFQAFWLRCMLCETWVIFRHLVEIHGVGNMGDFQTFGWVAWCGKLLILLLMTENQNGRPQMGDVGNCQTFGWVAWCGKHGWFSNIWLRCTVWNTPTLFQTFAWGDRSDWHSSCYTIFTDSDV